MPAINAYEAIKYIKAHPHGKHTVIIAVTGSAFEEERTAALSAGCDDFVRKPLEEAAIFEKMTEHLGIRYIYEKPIQPDPDRPEVSPAVLLSEALAVMPAQWRAQLQQAATQVDGELLLQLRSANSASGSPISEAADRFGQYLPVRSDNCLNSTRCRVNEQPSIRSPQGQYPDS